MLEQTELITTKQAAKFLSVSYGFLANLRHQNTGPRFYRLGNRTVKYAKADLLDWFQRRHVETED